MCVRVRRVEAPRLSIDRSVALRSCANEPRVCVCGASKAPRLSLHHSLSARAQLFCCVTRDGGAVRAALRGRAQARRARAAHARDPPLGLHAAAGRRRRRRLVAHAAAPGATTTERRDRRWSASTVCVWDRAPRRAGARRSVVPTGCISETAEGTPRGRTESLSEGGAFAGHSPIIFGAFRRRESLRGSTNHSTETTSAKKGSNVVGPLLSNGRSK